MNTQLQEAIKFIKSGDKKSGYHLLVEVIKAEPSGKDAETAWLWMSSILNDSEKKRKCLETVLKLNPNNELAKKGLARLSHPPQSELPNLDSIASKPSEKKSTEAEKSVEPQKSKSSQKNTLLIILLAIVSCMCLAILSGIGGSLDNNNAGSTTYNVVFRVTGSSGNASITYGKSGDTLSEVQVAQLPWESSMNLRYEDTAALVALKGNNSSVTCEIWVDGKLATSAVSSSQTDNMAVCGFIVGRNITIRVTE
jgi:hypothetical protein